MEDKCEGGDNGKVADDVMLPGFRFHPTDEELVGFYLRRKIQGRALAIELIKQVDIYKHDPWDLPKFATTGEKEWYFYCPRDRKYRNSARPNRVTGAGFWKATGTDRPIYSSEGSRCIGLKKSLVFYRGRAAKGIKTDWMMHEFRLPPVAESNPPNKKFLDRNIPPNDSWAICRIFKKTNSMAQQRALTHHWASIELDPLGQGSQCTTQFGSENISCTTDIGSAIQLGPGSNNDQQQHSNAYFSSLDIQSYRPNIQNVCKSSSGFPVSHGEVLNNNFMFSPLGVPGNGKCSVNASSTILGHTMLEDASKASENMDFGGSPQFTGGFSISLASDLQASMGTGVGEEETGTRKNSGGAQGSCQWVNLPRSMGFPFNLPMNMPWDSPPCPSDMSSGFSTNKCYT